MSLSLAEMYETVADVVADREAIACGDERVSFGELDARANRAAYYQLTAGFADPSPEDVTRVSGIERIVDLLGRSKAGLECTGLRAPGRRSKAQLAAIAVGYPEMPYLLATPMTTKTTIRSLFSALLRGNTVVLPSRYGVSRVPRIIQDERVFGVTVTDDTMARQLAEQLAAVGSDYDLSTWYLLGSDSDLSMEVRARFRRLRPQLVINSAGFLAI